MDSHLLRQALEYHGEGLEYHMREEQGIDPGRLPHPSQLSQGYVHTEDRDAEFNQRLMKFIAKKADLLYQETDDDTRQPPADIGEDDFYAIMPPLETFMGIPPDGARYHFFNSLEKRDVVIGVVSSVLDSGLVVTLLCMDKDKCRDLDNLKITAFCPVKELPKDYGGQSPVDAFQVKDKVRAVVISVNPETDKIILSLLKKSLPLDTPCPKLGVINDDEFPVYYRRYLQIHGVTYDELLHSIMGFNNSFCAPYLVKELGVEPDSHQPPSLRRSLSSVKLLPSETADGLRKAQSAKWAMKSVKEGVAYFKAGKSLEAMQMLNKALQVDVDNVEALVARGALYANNESYSKAIDDFNTALKANPAHNNAQKYLLETLIAKGRELHDYGRFEEAEGYYYKALEINRSDPEVIHYLRLCHRHEAVQVPHKGSRRGDSDREDVQSRSSSHQDFPLSQTKERLKRLIEEDERGQGSKKHKPQHGDWPTSPEPQNRMRRVSEPKYERMTSVSPSERKSQDRDDNGRQWEQGKHPGRHSRSRGRAKSGSPDSPDSSKLYGNSSSSTSRSSSSSSTSSSSSSGSSSSGSSSGSSRSPSPKMSSRGTGHMGEDERGSQKAVSERLSKEKEEKRRSRDSSERHFAQHNTSRDSRERHFAIHQHSESQDKGKPSRRSREVEAARDSRERRFIQHKYSESKDKGRSSKRSREVEGVEEARDSRESRFIQHKYSESNDKERPSRRARDEEGVEEARKILASKRVSHGEIFHHRHVETEHRERHSHQEGFRNRSPPPAVLHQKDTDLRTFQLPETLQDTKSKNLKLMEYLDSKHNLPPRKQSPKISHSSRSLSPHTDVFSSPARRSTPGTESSAAVTPDKRSAHAGSPVCRKTGGLVVRGHQEDMPTHFRAGTSGSEKKALPGNPSHVPYKKGPPLPQSQTDMMDAEGEQLEDTSSRNKRYEDIKIKVRNDKCYIAPQEGISAQTIRMVSGGTELAPGRENKDTQERRDDSRPRESNHESVRATDVRSRSQSASRSSTGRPRSSEDRDSERKRRPPNLPDVVASASKPQDKRSTEHKRTRSRSRQKSGSREKHRRRSRSRSKRGSGSRERDRRRTRSRSGSRQKSGSRERDNRRIRSRSHHRSGSRERFRHRSRSRSRRRSRERHGQRPLSGSWRRSASRNRRSTRRESQRKLDVRGSSSSRRTDRKRKRSSSSSSSSSSTSSSSSSRSRSNSRAGSPPARKKTKVQVEDNKKHDRTVSETSRGQKGTTDSVPQRKSASMLYIPRQLQVKSAATKPTSEAPPKQPAPDASASVQADKTKTKQELKEMEDFLSQLKEKKKQQLIAEGVFDKYKKPT